MTSSRFACRKWSCIVALSIALAACAVVSEPADDPTPVRASAAASTTPFREDCHQHLLAAMAALAAPADTTPGAIPAAHVHGVAMHEYHSCLGRASAAQTTPR